MTSKTAREFEDRFREELTVSEAYRRETELLRGEVKVLKMQLQEVSKLACELRDALMPAFEPGPKDY